MSLLWPPPHSSCGHRLPLHQRHIAGFEVNQVVIWPAQRGERRGDVCILNVSIHKVQGPLLSGRTADVLFECRQNCIHGDVVEVSRHDDEGTGVFSLKRCWCVWCCRQMLGLKREGCTGQQAGTGEDPGLGEGITFPQWPGNASGSPSQSWSMWPRKEKFGASRWSW